MSHPFVALPSYQERYEEMCRALESGLKDLGLNTNFTIDLGEDFSSPIDGVSNASFMR